MARIACLIVRTKSGEFVDATGKPVSCVAEGEGVGDLIETYKRLRSNPIIKRGKDEIGIAELRLLANHTNGGELKAAMKFR